MNLNNLKPSTGSTFSTKRIGRGQGSGYGGTSTKGHKGQKARAGYSQKIGFEGGQMPLQRRLPKFGFKNVNRKEFRAINLDTIQTLIDTKNITGEITREVLVENGLASKNELVKILGRGDLKSGISITADKFTKSAEEAINKAGGKAITTL
ncbi:50S ribosomal protein L15 [compost metagenome]|jgi:large subunit ribosomal protein L15